MLDVLRHPLAVCIYWNTYTEFHAPRYREFACIYVCVSVCTPACANSAYAWLCLSVQDTLPRSPSSPAWFPRAREGKRVQKGRGWVSPGCHGEAARPLWAESVGPRLVQQRRAVDMQQGDEAWTEDCRPFIWGNPHARGERVCGP
jgi:hypothetical protein